MRINRPMLAQRAKMSVLDRLLDNHPACASDDPSRVPDSIDDLRHAVHRDLEALLNTRRPWRQLDGRRRELLTSPMAYGLSDVTAGTLNGAEHREAVRHEIETLIQRFEPRLAHVRVSLLPDNAPLESTLPLAIDALLLIDPEPEPIRFGTIFDPMSASLALQALQEG